MKQSEFRNIICAFALMLLAQSLYASVCVQGHVTASGKPAPGVAVSDGVNVVVTDSLGAYSLISDGRDYIFVSVPSWCEIPVEDGMPKIYQPISSADGGVIERDFNLTASKPKTNWSLLTLADIQIDDPDMVEFASDIIPKTTAFVSSLSGPVYGISLGDMVWNAPHLYPAYKEQIARIGVPVFSVIGNHDHNEKIHGDAESDIDFRRALGPTYYSANIGNVHLVVLDDVLYSGVKHRNDYTDSITEQQMQWLERDLALVDSTATIVVGVHIPTARRNSPGHVANNERLYNLLSRFSSVEILSGHSHYQFTTTISPTITETTFGSVMGAFWYPICNDGSPRGHAVLRFEGSKLADKYYVGSDYTKDYQMKLYAPSDAVLYDPKAKPGDPFADILINIFCWHHTWQVDVNEDASGWKPLDVSRRIIPAPGFRPVDPDVRKCLVKGRIPSTHAGSTPAYANDHMFLYTPAPNWHKVEVRAKDPYGNIYTQSIINPAL